MTIEPDDQKRPLLRLVVNNADKRGNLPKPDGLVSFAELLARRESYRIRFYLDMASRTASAYAAVEQFAAMRGWTYGLDPLHGRLIVIPARVVCPTLLPPGDTFEDEILIHADDDASGNGLCLSLEMLLPYYHEDNSVMEDALFYAPILQYGTMFLEENPQDGYLDLIYRLAFPLYPPEPGNELLERFFAVATHELTETLQSLAGLPPE